MLTISNLTYSYGRHSRPVLENYSLLIEPGTICGLLGRNGAGKSTLLYLLTGLLKPQRGCIEYNGFIPWHRNISFLNDVFLVPEEFELPNVSLAEFIDVTAPFYPKFSISDFRRHLETFELSHDVHLGHLSMGQKKRVFISFALACNTSLLILDEPTNGLDIPGKRLFRKAILSSMTDDRIIIVSTHQVYDIEKILDRIIITDNGGVLLDASVTEITSKLNFKFTTDKRMAASAILSLDAPGGYNIIEQNTDDDETDINLESLFELTCQRPDEITRIFEN
ncbi:MAG: ABC transporter ATP-binding protein [Bacteroides sp.]|nr:ABC transporter ATP-binding protein [Bacteroides sp.]